MDRRAFLRRLGFGTVAAAAAATGVLDLERLLWVPGEKQIFIPPLKLRDLGISIRFIREFDPASARLVNRMDFLFGYPTIRPDLACRVVCA